MGDAFGRGRADGDNPAAYTKAAFENHAVADDETRSRDAVIVCATTLTGLSVSQNEPLEGCDLQRPQPRVGVMTTSWPSDQRYAPLLFTEDIFTLTDDGHALTDEYVATEGLVREYARRHP